MKTRILAAAMILADITSAKADPATGLWKTPTDPDEGYFMVRIDDCKQALCGTVVAAHDPAGQERKDFTHIGHQLLRDMQPEGQGQYGDGQAQLPDMQRALRADMKLQNADLSVRVCMVGGVLCDQQKWTRIE